LQGLQNAGNARAIFPQHKGGLGQGLKELHRMAILLEGVGVEADNDIVDKGAVAEVIANNAQGRTP
jgi:hypothetical protein